MRLVQRVAFHVQNFLLKSKFDSKNYWNMRYAKEGNSGLGSYGAHAENKANFVNQAVKDYNINTIIEFGCGDGNQLKFYQFKKYLGLDLSPVAINMCNQIHGSDGTKSFMLFDPKSFVNNKFITADMVLSSEVIFHLTEKNVFDNYLKNLFLAANKLVLIISTNHNENGDSPTHIFHRKFTDEIEKSFPTWKRVTVFPSEYAETNRIFGEYFHLFVKQDTN